MTLPETDDAMMESPFLLDDVENILRCPSCKSASLNVESARSGVVCQSCGGVFPVHSEGGWCSFMPQESDTNVKADIRAWWGDLYQQLYADNDAKLTVEDYSSQLDHLEDFFEKTDHLAVNEMPIKELAGKKVLEIGSGSGANSALFKKHGADIVSVDITPERVKSTALKFRVVAGGPGRAYQADAERLPFRDESFDIVYSNGVLHHSENTENGISEVRRVLKPGGLAVLMLYSRHSANFYLNILPRGLGTGYFFKYPPAEWVGLVTEGKPKHSNVKNPITRVYSAKGIKDLLSDFEILGMRKAGYEFDQMAIPRLTKTRRAVLKAIGFPLHPGGIPVAGIPRMPPTRIERYLSRHIGFNWDIRARKPHA